MSEHNAQTNRAVWFDIPVADLDRAAAFYREVLAIGVERHTYGDVSFCVLEHDQGNGGCLVPAPDQVARDGGVLLYLNVDGRIRAAVEAVRAHGGEVLEDVHVIGEHGVRAVVRDSEGNRIALHSGSDT
jgi:predicted enzyme related to lactoylglutathione lyase